ncbi:hypothetical protein, partial [Candidatus Protofrankia californiensis]|uniref:hypothetical protein n=1 Tax=Candidatus Protofrankia californiensis TaxID=1839754 RepID=UPI0013EE34E6
AGRVTAVVGRVTGRPGSAVSPADTAGRARMGGICDQWDEGVVDGICGGALPGHLRQHGGDQGAECEREAAAAGMDRWRGRLDVLGA